MWNGKEEEWGTEQKETLEQEFGNRNRKVKSAWKCETEDQEITSAKIKYHTKHI